MSFGEHYQYKKPVPVLTDGVYDITLQEPFETTVGGYRVLRFPFTVDGIKEEVRPNYFDLFDCSDPNNHEKLEMFQKNASRILDCFGMEGAVQFPDNNSFFMRKGRVEIKKSDAGFVNVSKFLPKEKNSVDGSAVF